MTASLDAPAYAPAPAPAHAHARPGSAGGRTGRPLAPWALTVVVLAGQAMASLDSAIVNVAGPAMQHDLRLSGPALQLAVYSYLLVYAVALVAGARLGSRYGFGRLFAWGVAVFTAGSLACGLAVSPAMLIAGRTVQGAGAALLVPQVLSLLQVTFEGEPRRRAMSLYGLVLAVGVAAGQVLGGILITADLLGTGWRPVFLVNVPVGLAILTLGADAGWPGWSWPVLAAGLAALALFARHERRLSRTGRDPLVDPDLLNRPGIRSGLAGIFALHASYGGLLFTTAVYLQHALHESPLASGLTFAGYAAGFAAASVAWTRLPAGWQPRLPLAAFATFATTCALLSWFTSAGGWPWQSTALLVIAGAAHGTGFDVLAHRTAAGVPAARAASFSGVLATVNQLAIVAGVAVAGTIYLSARMPVVLLALAAAQAATGAALARRALTQPASLAAAR